jgi:integrase
VRFSNFVSLRNFFMCVLCFKGFLRQSEASALEVADVWVEHFGERRVLFVYIEKSKTDQGRVGELVVLGDDLINTWRCPVRLFFLFQSLPAREAFPSRTAFFPSSTSRRHLATSHVNDALKRMCIAAGIPPAAFSSHCLRAGGTTTAAAAGIATRLLRKHGRWALGSNCIFTYISPDVASLLTVGDAV